MEPQVVLWVEVAQRTQLKRGAQGSQYSPSFRLCTASLEEAPHFPKLLWEIVEAASPWNWEISLVQLRMSRSFS